MLDHMLFNMKKWFNIGNQTVVDASGVKYYALGKVKIKKGALIVGDYEIDRSGTVSWGAEDTKKECVVTVIGITFSKNDFDGAGAYFISPKDYDKLDLEDPLDKERDAFCSVVDCEVVRGGKAFLTALHQALTHVFTPRKAVRTCL